MMNSGSTTTLANMTTGINNSLTSDEEGDMPSSPDSGGFDDADLMSSSAITDEVTAQLAAAGPVGVAAAAAISSSRKRKRPYSFETNPSVRKRQQTRLLRKLKQTIDEYATRVGQQAVVVVATPSKPAVNGFKVFGAKPLEDVIRNMRGVVLQELEQALAEQAPPPPQEDPTLHELPPLVIDGIPTPVEKMTQAQLRAFIPLMLKYSTGRGKPGWGKESTRPLWWPKDLPWANVRMDARTEDQKQKVSWTHALRQIVINCYKYHGREDLLPAFTDDDDKDPSPNKMAKHIHSHHHHHHNHLNHVTHLNHESIHTVAHYTPAVVQTITNSDGTVSIIQVDPNNPIITLPDGTTAHVQGVAIPTSEGQSVQTLAEVVTSQSGSTIDLVNSEAHVTTGGAITGATINQEGQIILTGDDGQSMCLNFSGDKKFSGVITVPVPVSMYQTMVGSVAGGDASQGSLQVVTPLVTPITTKVEPSEDDEVSNTMSHMGDGDASNNSSQGVPTSTSEVLQITVADAVTSASPTQPDTNSAMS